MKKVTARVSARSSNIDFDGKYQTGYCIPTWLRDEQVKIALKKVKGRAQVCTEKRKERIAVVGYGPSLKKTWPQIKQFKYIITTSGAHKFLIEKGIIPTWHLDVDPRGHKIAMLGKIHKKVTYLPCSSCHPNYIDALLKAKAKIELWHCFSGEAEALRVLPPGEYAITGGCDAGLRAMSLARFFGFVNIDVFGMDGCGQEGKGHADTHTNPMKKFFDMEYPKGSGQIFRTTPSMMEIAKTVPHETDMLKLSSVKFHGHGLVQAIMKTYKPKPNVESNIAFVKPTLISDEYRELNKKLHDERGDYGAGGFRHAHIVLKLCQSMNTTSVLDYGCGKGTLANTLPFPIWEYDPAIDGKNTSPRAANIVVCGDVLEHIEPENLDYVLYDLARVTLKVGYFIIHTGPAQKTLADGRNAHLIQEDADWWHKKLSKFFLVGSIKVMGNELHCVVGMKKQARKKKTVSKPETVTIGKKNTTAWTYGKRRDQQVAHYVN